ncbi:hypothetical protein NDU88_005724, partial [Pleurodeles waltl]
IPTINNTHNITHTIGKPILMYLQHLSFLPCWLTLLMICKESESRRENLEIMQQKSKTKIFNLLSAVIY